MRICIRSFQVRANGRRGCSQQRKGLKLEIEELKERYTSLPMAARISLAIAIGCSYSAYKYFDHTPVLETELAEVRGLAVRAEARYESARRSSEALPSLEVKLKDTEQQLKLARRYLPDEIQVDEVLHVVARLAKEFGVELSKFTPMDAGEIAEAGRYRQVPMDVSLKGDYISIARFFDSLVHLEQVVHLRNIQMSRAQETKDLNQVSSRVTLDATASLIFFVGVGNGVL